LLATNPGEMNMPNAYINATEDRSLAWLAQAIMRVGGTETPPPTNRSRA
jgi:hypothetical protein